MKTIVGDYTIGNYAHECFREGSKKWLKMMERCDAYYDNKCSKYCSVKDIDDCPLVNYMIGIVQEGIR